MPRIILHQCAWCKALELPGDVWLRADGLPLLHWRTSHTICPACKAEVLADYFFLGRAA